MTLTAGGTVRTKEEDEELAMAAYYRECRDYWRRQAESLAARWDKHMRAEHNTMSHEQLFQEPQR